MTLKLKTNRNGIIVWWLPLLIIGCVICIAMFIEYYCFNSERNNASEIAMIVQAVFWGGYLLGILLYKFGGRRLHLFSNEFIQVFEGKKCVYNITVEDIAQIRYVKCNIKYLWKRISGDSMLDGYACKMYVFFKQGNEIALGCFSTREAKKIKKMYGDFVQIV